MNGIYLFRRMIFVLYCFYEKESYICIHLFQRTQFYLFADDTNILYADKNLKSLEHTVNTELHKLYVWLTSNKLSLNIKKSNFAIFRPYHKRQSFQPKISIQ